MGIEVEATAEGYFGGIRRHVGDRFEVPTEKQLGHWMRRLAEKEVALDKMKVEDLRALAAERGIENAAELKKTDLVEALG